MRPRGALKLGIEKIADKIHVSSMRLRGALKLGIEKLLTRFMSAIFHYFIISLFHYFIILFFLSLKILLTDIFYSAGTSSSVVSAVS